MEEANWKYIVEFINYLLSQMLTTFWKPVDFGFIWVIHVVWTHIAYKLVELLPYFCIFTFWAPFFCKFWKCFKSSNKSKYMYLFHDLLKCTYTQDEIADAWPHSYCFCVVKSRITDARNGPALSALGDIAQRTENFIYVVGIDFMTNGDYG